MLLLANKHPVLIETSPKLSKSNTRPGNKNQCSLKCDTESFKRRVPHDDSEQPRIPGSGVQRCRHRLYKNDYSYKTQTQMTFLPIFGKVRPQFHNIRTQSLFYLRVLHRHHIYKWVMYILEWCTEHKSDVHSMHHAHPVRYA